MEHSILESVIKITNQRDVDSLEYSLVATLAADGAIEKTRMSSSINIG